MPPLEDTPFLFPIEESYDLDVEEMELDGINLQGIVDAVQK
jgi:hypothetical protein